MKRNTVFVVLGVMAGVGIAGAAVQAALTPTPGALMAAAANRFVSSLSAEQKKAGVFAVDDPGRMEWFFIPKDRTGVPLKVLAPAQRELAHALLKTGVSATGYAKATSIMELEKVLAVMEKDPVKRDPEKYYFSVFGTPSADGTWGWKVEGHHVSLNFTVVKGATIATTPSFFGTNPAEVREGALKGRRVLHAEEDLGRALLLALDPKQRAQAIFTDKAPAELVTANASKVDPLAPVGVAAKNLTKPQAEMLHKILDEYAGNMPPALAADRLAKVQKAGFDNVYFAWAGGPNRGDPHYYRIQGPTFLIEYDNTQTNANHVHTVWRDFAGDFGRDLLREHIKNSH